MGRSGLPQALLRTVKSTAYLPSLLLLLTLGSSPAAGADAGIYVFVDDHGAINLSNDPDDARYQVLVASAPPAAAGTAVVAQDNRAWLQYRDLIQASAARFQLDPALLRAVINAESGYNPNAVSRRGAGGLMQLMPMTARRLGVANVFDPAENVVGGARYLVELLQLFDNDLQLALAAYNAGEAAVLKYGRRIPPYRETTEYVSKVVAFYRQYRSSM